MNKDLEMDDSNSPGLEMYQLISELYPICRSITGDGVRKTLQIVQHHIPLETYEVPTGTAVYDWLVPKEWNIHDAYVKDQNGHKVIDFQSSNLHILNYSIPIHKTVPLAELKQHLFTLPDYPDWIPYRTSYYEETWGFCLTHHTLQDLTEGDYEVYIDSSLKEGHLTYSEYFIPGSTPDEVLFSCHTCHPSLCNDNLSGIALATYLAKNLSSRSSLRYSYRFIFIPGTIGSITWLSRNEDRIHHIKHGLVIAGVGNSGSLTYKKSRRGNTEIDRAVTHVLQHSGDNYTVNDFSPYGYDERQYCSPGFNLPIGSLTRTPFGTYPEYHTSADNLEFVNQTYLADSFAKYLAIINLLEHNQTYLNTNPKCEPQLGTRGLYTTLGGKQTTPDDRMAILWVLNLSDKRHTLLDISEQSGIEFYLICNAADALLRNNLLIEC
ncbi:MAG: DUF4910 domain-containing protein [Acaryochloris sp. RU_4_1]|nr:DUF4910 domain-containing protein [Acaryochloris sp. RU_4_1]